MPKRPDNAKGPPPVVHTPGVRKKDLPKSPEQLSFPDQITYGAVTYVPILWMGDLHMYMCVEKDNEIEPKPVFMLDGYKLLAEYLPQSVTPT